jgi:hypothetical protein
MGAVGEGVLPPQRRRNRPYRTADPRHCGRVAAGAGVGLGNGRRQDLRGGVRHGMDRSSASDVQPPAATNSLRDGSPAVRRLMLVLFQSGEQRYLHLHRDQFVRDESAIPIAPKTGWYVARKDGQRTKRPSTAAPRCCILTKFPVASGGDQPADANRVNVLMPNGWKIEFTSNSWPTPLSGAVKAWTQDATFNFTDWSLLSEAPTEYKDTTGKFADGTGYVEVIGYEKVVGYRDWAVAFLETRILRGRPVEATEFVAASAKKLLVIKLGRRSRSDIAQLKKHRSGPIMDVKRLETEGRLDRDAKIAVALVH